MARTLRAAVAVALLTFVALANVPAASADVTQGVEYLASVQDEFGGWDGDPASVFGEFTTSEAILAIAEVAQTGATWSTADAFDTVDQLEDDLSGYTPLDYMADAATAQTITPGKAAKWLVNVALPLGLGPTDFLGSDVNLVTEMGPAGADGSFGTGANFSGAAYAAMASFLLDGNVPTQTVSYLLAAQTPNGGWPFNGQPDGFADPDTTSLTIEALIAGGVSPTDPAIVAGLEFLVAPVTDGTGYDGETGWWVGFDAPNPENTMRGMVALVAGGYDLATPCWRDTLRPDLVGTPYTTPSDALLALQNPPDPDGNAGWNGFTPSYTTAQAVQGLEVGTWRPIVVGAAQTCETPVPPTTTPATVADAVVLVPTFTG